MTSQGGERIIFEGCVEYDASEKAHIRKFLEEVKKKSSFNFPEDWPESETLRFLQANGFKYKPTLKSMQEYIQWKQAIFPVALTPTIEKYLVYCQFLTVTDLVISSKKELCMFLAETAECGLSS